MVLPFPASNMFIRLTTTLFWCLFGLTTLLASCSATATSNENFRQRGIQQPLYHTSDDIQTPSRNLTESQTLSIFVDTLDVLQDEFFAVWEGIWPTSIDWTSAVIGTYISSALITLSSALRSKSNAKINENTINRYFSQLVASYFGQDAFGLRQEAYDDMLWVVLGWLESIKFINLHSALHYEGQSVTSTPWHGAQWVPAFAHRARIFWELASQGWDTTLCDGGMIWSPYLVPYKNAITNELFISASVSMYLHFPGDDNTSPFSMVSGQADSNLMDQAQPHDQKYLAAAIRAYKWLSSSNMTDAKGLYVDGFHISGYNRDWAKSDSTSNRQCDARNEMVYTYNQGVLLSGQRGLYEATGTKAYLEDGHKLIVDVIAATGWNLAAAAALDLNVNTEKWPRLGKWHGLGRAGILEESCDAPGYCSQDAQTFKGIFFHHLTQFCGPLSLQSAHLSKAHLQSEDPSFEDEKAWHDEQCKRYGQWIRHNARAALSTLDSKGKFGMWWGAPKGFGDIDSVVELPREAVDYRNQGVPAKWKESRKNAGDPAAAKAKGGFDTLDKGKIGVRDLNDRGRGRTVETQGGGVSVLRALWELVDRS